MLIARLIVRMLSVGAMVVGSGVVSGQAYPNKTIRIITSEIGAGNDLLARLVARGISGPLGQAVIVENRGATASAVIAARALPDGYTLSLAANALWLAPFMQDMPYDPVRDFLPVTTVSNQPLVLIVNSALPVKSIKELIALAKAKPGELNYGSSNTGTVSHLAGELFKFMAEVNIVRVPFKGSGPALTALLGSQVQLTFPTPSVVPPHLKAGKLRALAVTGLQPSPLLPDVPTMSASGLPGFEVVSRAGIFAPAKTPGAIVSRLNQEIVRTLNSADVTEKLLAMGSEPAGSTPEEFRNLIKADMARMGKVIKDAGIRGGE